MNQLTVISADDWEGIYLNDENLLCEGHSVSMHELVKYMSIYNTFEVHFESFNDEGSCWIEDRGSLPQSYVWIPQAFIIK